MSTQNISSAFPEPPFYYKQYTNENLALLKQLKEQQQLGNEEKMDTETEVNHHNHQNFNLLELEPPKPITDSEYYMFGVRWTVEDKLLSLEEQNFEQLYPENSIGTDITNDFFGYKGKGIIERINIPEIKSVPTGMSTSVLGQYTDILRERTKKYTTEKNSVAQVVDDMNVKYFLKAPLAIHQHSLFAIKKIATMVVAKLKETPDVVIGSPISPISPISPAPIFGPTNVAEELNDSEITKQDTAFRVKFRRYKLTSKAPINGRHYIEVQSRIKGQVVIRSYTPIEGNIAQSFRYEIQVRGPFDVGDREVLQTPLLSQTVDAKSQYRKSGIYSLSAKNIPLFISSSTSSLLNPNTQDGHWKELYMICGGTGITPMLQLIIYHLELCMRRNRLSMIHNKRVSMHLLYGNHRIEDIIDGVELEEYQLSSRGMLTITYALNKPTQSWTGKVGEINQEMVSDWLSEFVVDDNKSQITADDNDINTNTTNPLISKSPPQFYDPLSYDNNNDNPPPIIPHHTKPHKLLLQPIIMNNNQNIYYRTSINPETYSGNNVTTVDNNKKKPKLNPNSKIFVCGKPGMMNVVEQTLKYIGYTEEDFILIV
ncbi:17184_t:CDS:2 [Entrophospora sp. SA101]|nr:17184_t:CDS:2 [Entrophospora sp. SA101]